MRPALLLYGQNAANVNAQTGSTIWTKFSTQQKKSGPSPRVALDKAPSAACVRLVVKKKKLTVIPVQKVVQCTSLEFRQRSLCLPREKPQFTVSRTQCFQTKKKTRYLKRAYSNNNNAPQLVLFYGSIKKIWRPRSQRCGKTCPSNDHSRVGLPVVAKGAKDALGKEKKRTPLAHNHC